MNIIKVPTVLFIVKNDNTIFGKALLSPQQQAQHGQYSKIGPETAQKITGCKLVEFDNCKHIPHIEVRDQFLKVLLEYL